MAQPIRCQGIKDEGQHLPHDPRLGCGIEPEAVRLVLVDEVAHPLRQPCGCAARTPRLLLIARAFGCSAPEQVVHYRLEGAWDGDVRDAGAAKGTLG